MRFFLKVTTKPLNPVTSALSFDLYLATKPGSNLVDNQDVTTKLS